MNVAIYVRVSTQEQAREGYSIGEQIERLTKYCEAMQWAITETFVDPGYSGGSMDRPGLKTMIRAVEQGNIDKVVVYKLDRLSRSQKDTLYLIEDVFLKHNADFVSMNENFDTSTPFGRAMIGILAVFAQLEREQIKERMAMGKEARAKEGKWNGGAFEPIGYEYDKTCDLLRVNEYEAMQIREIYELFLDSTPVKTIERILGEKGYTHKYGIWDPKTIKRVLSSKTYIGCINYQGDTYKGEHDPIIDTDSFEKAAALLQVRAEQYRQNGVRSGKINSYLGGLLYCKHCGGKFAKDRQNMRGGKPYKLMYICNSRSKRVRKMIKDPNCKNKRWSMDELDKIVFDEIRKLAFDPQYYDDVKKDQKAEQSDDDDKIAILERKIENIDDQISRFMDLYGIGKFTIDQISDKIDPLNDSRQNLQKELDALNAAAGRLNEDETMKILQSFDEVIETGDFDEIRTLIESLINRIVIDNDDVYIYWNFA